MIDENIDEQLELEGTALLRRHGYDAAGRPRGKRRGEIWYDTMPNNLLESLRQVHGVGGAVHRCMLGRRVNEDTDASDAPDNDLTLVHHAIED